MRCLGERAFGFMTSAVVSHASASTTPGADPGGIVPRHFAGYEVLDEIGRGGMGVVYLARHAELNRFVAIKVIAGGALATAETEGRFIREAQTTARLTHPNIIGIHTAGRHDGRLFYVMDYVEGRDLGTTGTNQPLAAHDAARLLAAVARGVQHAHERGVVHRDLKPSNILINHDGTPRIADFGLARWSFETPELTRPGQVLGSPAYMAPEQTAGTWSAAVDIYGLGAILFFALTGRAPHVGKSTFEILASIAREPAPPPSTLRSEIPASLDAICLRCLSVAPEARYSSALVVAEELERFLVGEAPETPFPPLVEARRLVEEVRALVARHAYEPDRLASYTEKLTRASQLNPKLHTAHIELARLQLHLFTSNADPSPARREMALQSIERAEALAPTDLDTRVVRITYRVTAGGESIAAWPELRELAHKRPADLALQLNFVRTAHRLGHWAEALRAARLLVRHQPTATIPRQLLGYTLVHLRDYPDAAVWAREAVELDGRPLFRRLAAIWYSWLSDPEPNRTIAEIRALPEHKEQLRMLQWCESQILLADRNFAAALVAYRGSAQDVSSTLEQVDATVYTLRLERWANDPAAATTEARLRRLLEPGRAKAARQPYDEIVEAYAHAVLGNSAEAQSLADLAVENILRVPDAIAHARVQGANEFFAMPGRLVILALCDARERFFAEFERLLNVPAALDLRYLAMDPTFDSLRVDPRFNQLLRAAQMPILLPAAPDE